MPPAPSVLVLLLYPSFGGVDWCSWFGYQESPPSNPPITNKATKGRAVDSR